ncbi:MAG: hypothetical protein Q9160_009236, partial [Pyrenula sp. 1 TL-2023]
AVESKTRKNPPFHLFQWDDAIADQQSSIVETDSPHSSCLKGPRGAASEQDEDRIPTFLFTTSYLQIPSYREPTTIDSDSEESTSQTPRLTPTTRSSSPNSAKTGAVEVNPQEILLPGDSNATVLTEISDLQIDTMTEKSEEERLSSVRDLKGKILNGDKLSYDNQEEWFFDLNLWTQQNDVEFVVRDDAVDNSKRSTLSQARDSIFVA